MMPHRVATVYCPGGSLRQNSYSSTASPSSLDIGILLEAEHTRSRDHEVAQDAQTKEDERLFPIGARAAEASGSSAYLTSLDTQESSSV